MKAITPIGKFKNGATVQGFYLCVEKHLRHSRSGDLYLDLLLRDRSGQIHAKVWDKVETYSQKFTQGDPVAVAGMVDTFQERLQLIVKRINKASVRHYGRYGYDPTLLVPASDKDPQQMWKAAMSIIRQIKNHHLRNLLQKLYRQHEKRILTHPASLAMHHNYRSGYLEHILSMATSGKELAAHYQVDVDLLLAGIFLHDIGKLVEISPGFEHSYSDQGNFLGHIIISRDMVREAITKTRSFPAELQLKLEHMILAHQGKYEWQSPKKPKFKEALLLHLIDILDTQMNMMERALEDDRNEGLWTDRRNYFRVPLYKGRDESE